MHPGVKHTRDALRMLNVPYMVRVPVTVDSETEEAFIRAENGTPSAVHLFSERAAPETHP